MAQVVHQGGGARCEKEACDLIDEGASANAYLARPESGARASILTLALLRGLSDDFIERLLQEGADPNGLGNRDLRLPIVAAVQNGRTRAVEQLIESGAWTRPSEHGVACWLMHEATQLRYGAEAADMVRLLARLGLDPNETSDADLGGESVRALHKACQRHGRQEVIEALLDCGATMQSGGLATSPAYHALRLGNQEELTLLLGRGADPNDAGSGALSLLHAAIEPPRNTLVSLLLEHGADHDQEHTTRPVCWAIMHGNTDALLLLLEAGADPFDHDADQDLMSMAEECKDPRMADVLRSAREFHSLNGDIPDATAARLRRRL